MMTGMGWRKKKQTRSKKILCTSDSNTAFCKSHLLHLVSMPKKKAALNFLAKGIKVKDESSDYSPRPSAGSVRSMRSIRSSHSLRGSVKHLENDILRDSIQSSIGAAAAIALKKLSTLDKAIGSTIEKCFASDDNDEDDFFDYIQGRKADYQGLQTRKSCVNRVGLKGAKDVIRRLKAALTQKSFAKVMECLRDLRNRFESLLPNLSSSGVEEGDEEDEEGGKKRGIYLFPRQWREGFDLVDALLHKWKEVEKKNNTAILATDELQRRDFRMVRHGVEMEVSDDDVDIQRELFSRTVVQSLRDLRDKTIPQVGRIMQLYLDGMQVIGAFGAIVATVKETVQAIDEDDPHGMLSDAMAINAETLLADLCHKINERAMTVASVSRIGRDIIYKVREIPELELRRGPAKRAMRLRKVIAERLQPSQRHRAELSNYLAQAKRDLTYALANCEAIVDADTRRSCTAQAKLVYKNAIKNLPEFSPFQQYAEDENVSDVDEQ